MSQVVRVGVVGLGTVGQGVLRVLHNNAAEITRRVGRPVQVTHVATRTLSAARDCSVEGIALSDDALTLARTAEIDVLVELIGGQGIAKEVILAALARGIPVVTANKALLAEAGNELFSAARAHGTVVAFEAAVAGGIPVIKAIREGLAGNRIDGLAGIINGTCNYILTQMAANGQSFADALADAQRLGYAEADPTFDIEGVDAAHKLAILAAIAFGMPLSFADVSVEGITKITPEDINIAQVFGYRIKLLGIAKRSGQGVELRVHPTLVPEDQLIAKVDGVLNAVIVNGNAVGQIGLYGPGAGGDPTASAVVADVVDIARALGSDIRHAVPALGFQPQAIEALPVLAKDQIQSAFYLRLQVTDEPGVLAKLTAALAEHHISVEAILQREPRGANVANVGLITDVVPTHRFNTAVDQILKMPFVHAGAARIRVEKI
ncbi:homoserine dehydrogenase [Sinimarinibacterium sp. NLF-5-8]|uniref:homoserine dehydrogenase n=1 Tax=Sinimarinibacterium sp. NLF-5-8 TaxID=2698684 RepID=UPI00137BBB75|nr:homoserine dehydrogenase [Sinimarinibacterium sp. NLF-5-8]QHS09390.1 homoserine dehydrogenase [Sinimarinibacterium sp. NLF-5-8]